MLRALELALRTHRGEGPRVAMCPACPDEVLVATFRWPGAEFYCLACDGRYDFVDPRPAEETPELLDRIEVARLAFVKLFPS